MREPVTSPTFTIGRRYADGRVPVAHLDLLPPGGDLDGEDPGLLDDYLTPDAIGFVEWPERGRAGARPAAACARVRLEHAGGDRARVEVAT